MQVTQPGRILVTGATGFLGRHLIAELLQTGWQVIGLVRPSRTQTAQERLVAVVTPLVSDLSVLDRLVALPGDVCHKTLGPTNWAELGHIDGVVHAASVLKFDESSRERVMATNVGGTANVLAVALAQGWQQVHYVSTAYVCGNVTGTISESLGDRATPPEFHNPYEESKWLAEHLVSQWQRDTGRVATILRPSIVIKSGPTDSRSGYYAFASAITAASHIIRSSREQVMIPGDPDAPLNLILIDDVTCAMRAVVEWSTWSLDRVHIVHITHPHPTRVADAFGSPLEWLGLDRWVVVAKDVGGNDSGRISNKLKRILAALLPYLLLPVWFQTDCISMIMPYHPRIITDSVLWDVLAQYRPELTRRERGWVDWAVAIARAVVKRVLNPSGIADVQQLYAAEARLYRVKHHLTTAFHDARLRKRAAGWVRKFTENAVDTMVLDLATGTGLTVAAIRERCPHVAVIGLDLNQEMIAVGTKAGRALVRGDATQFVFNGSVLPLWSTGTNSLDAITMVFGIGGIPNYRSCFREQLKALKVGGISVLIDIHSPKLNRHSCQLALGITSSPLLVWMAWQTVTLPIVLAAMWGWGDPTSSFYDLPQTRLWDDSHRQWVGFQIIHHRVETLRWWLGLPVMPICELVVQKVVFRADAESLG